MTALSNTKESEAYGRAGANARRLSVLALTSELPWPLNTGGHLRTFHLLRNLAQHCRCRLVSGAAAGQEDAAAILTRKGIDVHPVILPSRSAWRECIRAAGAAAHGEPYVFYRRHLHAGIRERLRQEVQRERPDALYLDHLDSLVYRDEFPDIPAVIDLHNIYSKLLQREARERRWPLRWWLAREAGLLERMEQRAAGRTDALMAVSEQEASHFQRLGAQAVHVVPNGVDMATYADLPTGRRSAAPLILYVGTMSWAPNVSAACFLAQEVLPKVRKAHAGARLRVVGKDPQSKVRELARLPGVEIAGAVPSILPHLLEACALAVPLTAGGGTRLKILEAFAAGLPVVSTTVGCEGLQANAGEHLLVAEREVFAEAMERLIADPMFGVRLAGRARELVRERYDWTMVGTTIPAIVAEAVATRRRDRAPHLHSKTPGGSNRLMCAPGR